MHAWKGDVYNHYYIRERGEEEGGRGEGGQGRRGREGEEE